MWFRFSGLDPVECSVSANSADAFFKVNDL
jgi:hypothetical protein